MTIALASGGMHTFGWTEERHLLAGIYDALNLNTRATGNWKKPPKFDPWPRPKVKDRDEEGRKKVTVASLFNRLQPK